MAGDAHFSSPTAPSDYVNLVDAGFLRWTERDMCEENIKKASVLEK